MERFDRLGVAAVVAFAGLLLVAGLQTGDRVPSGPTLDTDPAAALVDAWASTRTLTHRSIGTIERTNPDGTRLTVPTEVVQRPPDRLIRGFEEVRGRRDDRELICPAPLGRRRDVRCFLGPPGPSFEEVVAAEIAGFSRLVSGDDPLYDVTRTGANCWQMVRSRYDPRSGFGQRTELCFDQETGAVRSIDIDHGDVTETTHYDSISTVVSDDDLEP